jgi:hypothetical protein
LEAAMFMMPLGSRFADVPDVGGQLTQWHIHDNLCLKQNPTDPAQQLVAGLLANPNDPCPAGTTKVLPVPMLHVWILKNKCGPFSALDGLGAGVTDGNAPQWCDTLHGSVFP